MTRHGLVRLGWAALLVLGLLATVWLGVWLAAERKVNAQIRALALGHDVAVTPQDAPRLLHARALFHLARDQIDAADALAAALVRRAGGDPGLGDLVADVAVARGNARLRRAFARIDAAALDDAVPQVNLAKAAYREALIRNPGRWDAAVNYDIAQTLVRDLPRGPVQEEDDDTPQPKKVWTDLPGLPRGMP